MAKILYMSDFSGLSTGYGVVSKQLLTSFHQAGHLVKQIGWGFGQNDQNPYPFNIIPCHFHNDGMGEEILAQTIREFKPDILFTLGDPWQFEYVPELEERKAVFWINYFPLDGYPVPKEWYKIINDCDLPITFSTFAKKLADEISDKVQYISHGVDSEKFIPMDKQKLKKEKLGSAANKFIIGTVAKNQLRKNLPALMKAFAKFQVDKNDVALYLHTQERSDTFRVDEMIDHLKLNGKVFYLRNLTFNNGITEEDIVKTYNLFDVFVLPSMGEGFGLPLLESQSCEVPILATNYSSMPDLVVDDWQLLNVLDTITMGRNIEQAVVDVDDIVDKLNVLYDDWKNNNSTKLKELGKKGREKAISLDWSLINKEFVNVINGVESKAKKIPKRIYPKFYII